MARILGIDTGGTFTDSVVVDTRTREILCKAKALTTPAEISQGIDRSLRKLPQDVLASVSSVSLSTTLATNAIVEKRYCRTGLILIGRMPEGKLPADSIHLIEAEMSIKGQITREMDMAAVDDVIRQMAGSVEAFAVSGFASVRNPLQEQQVRDRIHALTDLPVVCAHELTGKLGFYERTVTCVLNAGLIPVIQELIAAVQESLQRAGVHAPLMVVRGDGSLIPEEAAVNRPIDTLLSGPAASVIGAGFLTGMQYGLVLDMGGTTTDIADLTDGKTRISKAGAVVDGWKTRVRAVDICTFGLGGDSYLYYDNEGRLQVGPRKVIPICVLAEDHPHIVDEMRAFRKPDGYELSREKSTDCFRFLREPAGHSLSEQEKKVLDVLREAPHSLYWLADHFGRDADKLGLTDLVEQGLVQRASATPTDLLVAEGHLNLYSREGAQIAVEIMADLGSVGRTQFIISSKRMIYRRIASLCIQSACSFEGQDADVFAEPFARYLMEIAFGAKESRMLQPEVAVRKPLIAIGAPVRAWLYNVGQHLHTTVIIPDHAEVANAVGAAMAQICEERTAAIRFDSATGRYLIFAGDVRCIEATLDLAKETGRALVEKAARRAATEAGAADCTITVDEKDTYVDIFTSGKRQYAQTVITATAAGDPAWIVET